jgi:hypothetical protein
VALGIAAAAAVILAAGASHPVRRFEEFKRVPVAAAGTSVQSHLLMTSGNGRWQLWHAAYDEFRAEPVHGGGAGSFESWWAQHGSIASFVVDAHSLYLETLAELGPLGLALLLACFGSGVAAGLLRLRRGAVGERVTLAGALAAFCAFAFEASVDWVWEVTAVGAVAFLLLAVSTGPATTAPAERRGRGGIAPRAALALVALALVAAQALPVVAAVAVRDSQRAARRGDGDAALVAALRARNVEPWAASPYVQLALVEELRGNLRAARVAIERALARDPRDWRAWLVAARVRTKLGAVRAGRTALERARALNPRSPLFPAASP